MKFVCLGYYDEKAWDGISEKEQLAFMDDCLGYDDVLKKNGHSIGGEGLDTVRNAATVRLQNGKAVVTDGPFAETKEQIGGYLILEAKDRAHAIELISKHPGLKAGPFEIRGIVDMTEVVRESEKRRGKKI
jgi:hypothetical protein